MTVARKIALSAFAIVLLAGCSTKPTGILLGDSAYEMKNAIVTMARELPPGRRDEFERAVETIILATTDRRLSMADERLSPQAITMLKGRTASQIIESAKLLRSSSAAF